MAQEEQPNPKRMRCESEGDPQESTTQNEIRPEAPGSQTQEATTFQVITPEAITPETITQEAVFNKPSGKTIWEYKEWGLWAPMSKDSAHTLQLAVDNGCEAAHGEVNSQTHCDDFYIWDLKSMTQSRMRQERVIKVREIRRVIVVPYEPKSRF